MGAACRTCGGVGYTGERVGGTMVEGQLVGQQFIPTEPCPDCTKSFDAREEKTGEFGPKKLLPSKAAPAQETYVDDPNRTFDPTEKGEGREAFFGAGEIAAQDQADLARMSREG